MYTMINFLCVFLRDLHLGQYALNILDSPSFSLCPHSPTASVPWMNFSLMFSLYITEIMKHVSQFYEG